MKPEERKRDIYFLKLLSRSFPNVATASTEIINLEAILNLPKGTEHFLADLHGEYLAFQHVLRNASGTIKRKVGEIFNDSLSTREQKDLCTLIYYPAEKLELVKDAITDQQELDDWYFITINRLVKVQPFQSTQGITSRLFLHYSGAHARAQQRSQQAGLCGCDHQDHHFYAPCR